jgi:hypothetical protein
VLEPGRSIPGQATSKSCGSGGDNNHPVHPDHGSLLLLGQRNLIELADHVRVQAQSLAAGLT